MNTIERSSLYVRNSRDDDFLAANAPRSKRPLIIFSILGVMLVLTLIVGFVLSRPHDSKSPIALGADAEHLAASTPAQSKTAETAKASLQVAAGSTDGPSPSQCKWSSTPVASVQRSAGVNGVGGWYRVSCPASNPNFGANAIPITTADVPTYLVFVPGSGSPTSLPNSSGASK